jgi:hypothetical protein
MHYDFNRFTSQSFERFAQALVAQEFGPGVQIYGDGPDGAREAGFEGKLAIKTQGVEWAGYVVVQAKHKRKSDDHPADDATWLEHELEREFKKFLNPRRNLRRPDFYLVITNARLTPAASRLTATGKEIGAGGQERIEKYLRSRQKELGFRGWLIWHADLLTAMLDSKAEIRTRFSAWITEGDVLAAALTQLERPTISQVVPLAIKKDLKRERDVKRKDAGQVTLKKIFVEDVFVDLPINFEHLPYTIHFDEDHDITIEEIEEDAEDTFDDEGPDDIDDSDIEMDFSALHQKTVLSPTCYLEQAINLIPRAFRQRATKRVRVQIGLSCWEVPAKGNLP